MGLKSSLHVASDVYGDWRERVLTFVGITVGGYTLGCFFGAVATIWLGNFLGRRKTIFVGSSIMVVGAALQCSAFSLGQLIAARLLTGFGNGMAGSLLCTKSKAATDMS